MYEFQTNKNKLNQGRIVKVPALTIGDNQVRVKIDRFAFTANNITYAVMGDQLKYWQFFNAHDNKENQWGIIPVWGFADIVESNNEELQVGERLFGYFPPASELIMSPSEVTPADFLDDSSHRRQLPRGYNNYRRVSNETDYNRANDNERMLLFVLHLTSFCLYDLLQSKQWFGAEQVVIISASSKTSTGLAYGLIDNPEAPSVVGLTSQRNMAMVSNTNAYNEVLTYDSIEKIDASKPTVIIDMSANTHVLSRLHTHLGENMCFTSNVGLTHWKQPQQITGINTQRSQQFFAPSYIQKRMQDWGPQTFAKRSMKYVTNSIAQSRAWLNIVERLGIEALEEVYKDVCDGKIAADEGIVIVM